MLLAKAACVCVIASCVECVVFFSGPVCVCPSYAIAWLPLLYILRSVFKSSNRNRLDADVYMSCFFFHMCVCNRCGWTRARNKDIPCGGLCCLIWCEPQSMRIGPHAPTKKNTHTHTFIHLICEEYKHVANPSTTSLWHKRTKAKE